MAIREAWTREYENAFDRIFGKKTIEYRSDCCNAPVKLSDPAPDFIGDNPKTMKVGTCYCICTKCGMECDIKND